MCSDLVAPTAGKLITFRVSLHIFGIRNTGTGGPAVVTEGKDALLTCVIMGSFENDTVIWRRGNDEILAAGVSRVTQDRRIRVLHDESNFTFSLRCARPLNRFLSPLPAPKGKTPSGGDVWVLLIKDTKPTDTGLYVCEVNSDPPFKSFHPLKGKRVAASVRALPPNLIDPSLSQ